MARKRGPLMPLWISTPAQELRRLCTTNGVTTRIGSIRISSCQPNAEGTVEVGYSVVPEYRRRGYATEATRAMIKHAFADAAVRRVIAHALPELVSSIGVLEKSLFAYAGPGSEPGAIRFVLEREVYESQHAAGRT